MCLKARTPQVFHFFGQREKERERARENRLSWDVSDEQGNRWFSPSPMAAAHTLASGSRGKEGVGKKLHYTFWKVERIRKRNGGKTFHRPFDVFNVV